MSSFRSTFAYTNITHLLAGRIVAKAAGAADWRHGPSPGTARSAGHEGLVLHRRSDREPRPITPKATAGRPSGTVEVPFTQLFPYDFGGAGDINSTIEDMARWVRLQLGNGIFEGRRIVSAENLAFTRTPKVGITDKVSYAMGWVIQQTPNGNIVWHNGGTHGLRRLRRHGARQGCRRHRPDQRNQCGFPGRDRPVDFRPAARQPRGRPRGRHAQGGKSQFETADKLFAKPASPRPFPPLAPLAGNFANPSFGKAAVALEGDALVMEFRLPAPS